MENRDLFYKMGLVKPPIQPWLQTMTKEYTEILVCLNPVSIESQALFYQFVTGDEEHCVLPLVPDVCMSFLFKCGKKDGFAQVSGFRFENKTIRLEPYTTYFGVKLYSTFGMKGWNIYPRDLINTSAEIGQVLIAPEIREIINEAKTFDQRQALFFNHYRKYWVDESYIPTPVEYVALLICVSSGNISMDRIEENTGYSKRYCRKLFESLYSASPKQYGKVIRFQFALRLLLSNEPMVGGLANIAFDAGYFDQPHFIRDFKSYTNISPELFQKQITDCRLTRNAESKNRFLQSVS